MFFFLSFKRNVLFVKEERIKICTGTRPNVLFSSFNNSGEQSTSSGDTILRFFNVPLLQHTWWVIKDFCRTWGHLRGHLTIESGALNTQTTCHMMEQKNMQALNPLILMVVLNSSSLRERVALKVHEEWKVCASLMEVMAGLQCTGIGFSMIFWTNRAVQAF